jgi:hypothetical protein
MPSLSMASSVMSGLRRNVSGASRCCYRTTTAPRGTKRRGSAILPLTLNAAVIGKQSAAGTALV